MSAKLGWLHMNNSIKFCIREMKFRFATKEKSVLLTAKANSCATIRISHEQFLAKNCAVLESGLWRTTILNWYMLWFVFLGEFLSPDVKAKKKIECLSKLERWCEVNIFCKNQIESRCVCNFVVFKGASYNAVSSQDA